MQHVQEHHKLYTTTDQFVFGLQFCSHFGFAFVCRLFLPQQKMPQSTQENFSLTPIDFKLKKITDFSSPYEGLFKDAWNSRTFQRLPLKFKDFSRLCKPSPTIAVFGHFYGLLFSVL